MKQTINQTTKECGKSEDLHKGKSSSRKFKRAEKTGKSWRGTNDMEKPYVGPNDIKWRTDSSLVVPAANIPFGQPLGLKFNRLVNYNPTDNSGTPGDLNDPIPGVLAVSVMLTAGMATDYNSPINLAARKSYSFIRHANSGSKNYEAVDLALYYVSVGQAIALLSFLKRIYVYSMRYSATNRYVPRTLLESFGVDADSVVRELAKIRFLIEWLAMSLNSLAIPRMPYFDMCSEVFLHIYRDSESPKDQFYVYVPYAFGKYNPAYNPNGGGIAYNELIHNQSLDADDLVDLAHRIMDVLLGDEDIGIISGDILKAYGDNLFKVTAVSVDEIATPVYSLEILQQIHNLELAGSISTAYRQNPGNANTAPYLEEEYPAAISNTWDMTVDPFIPVDQGMILDAFSQEPKPDEVVNCCVLKAHQLGTYSDGSQDEVVFTPTIVQHEAIVPVLFTIYEGVTGSKYDYTSDGSSNWFLSLESGVFSILKANVLKMTNFDWAPIVQFAYVDGSDYHVGYSGDIHNATIVNTETLSRIHEASILSLFGFEH